MRTLPSILLFVAVAARLSLPSIVAAQEVPAAAADLHSATLQAYKNITTSQTNIKLSMAITQNGQTMDRNYDFKLVLDKPADKLSFQASDMTLVIADGKLKFKASQIAERYLNKDDFGKLDPEKLLQTLPFLTGPMAAVYDLPLYLGQDAIPAQVEALMPDEQGRPGLKYIDKQGPITLRLDPKTHLIAAITREFTSPRGSATFSWQNDIAQLGQPVPDAAFTFDPGQAQPVATIVAMVGERQYPSLEGKPAPAFAVQDITGKEVSFQELQNRHKIIILDFWATWCGPCWITLPELQKVRDWVNEEKLPVGIYTVNVQETPEQAQKLWNELELTLPILMDAQGKLSSDYLAYAFPYMVVIHDGKVHKVHVGASPALETDLKAELQAILKKS